MNESKPALPPGSLIYVGEEMKHTVHLEGILYDNQNLETFSVRKVEELPRLQEDRVNWINVTGVHAVDVIRSLGLRFEISNLTLEDILNTEQRPKLDDQQQHIFIVIKMLYCHEGRIAYEHVSMILGKHYLITFQEQPWDVFEPIRSRLRQDSGRIRSAGADYLAYTLIDAIVDNYLLVMDHVEKEVIDLEEMIIENSQHDPIRDLHNMQRELIFLTKTFRSAREVLNRLQRKDSSLVLESTHHYLEDVNDHMIRAVETLEVQREIVNRLDTLHFSMINLRTNATIKILTTFASIFLPLTFIVGIYGMNFEHMPELHWTWGYPGVMLLLLVIAAGMITYFYRKKWF
ncbi:MAG: magnesium/cobalt transporter CorA [Verrucomicrobiota bacterium]